MENLAHAAVDTTKVVKTKTLTTTAPNGEQVVVEVGVTECSVGYPKGSETWDGFDPHESGYCVPRIIE